MVLQTKMMPQLEQWSRLPNAAELIFQQDNAPCHMAKSVKAFMTENQIQAAGVAGKQPRAEPHRARLEDTKGQDEQKITGQQ